jgi:hypothetical protein
MFESCFVIAFAAAVPFCAVTKEVLSAITVMRRMSLFMVDNTVIVMKSRCLLYVEQFYIKDQRSAPRNKAVTGSAIAVCEAGRNVQLEL